MRARCRRAASLLADDPRGCGEKIRREKSEDKRVRREDGEEMKEGGKKSVITVGSSLSHGHNAFDLLDSIQL